MKAKLVKFDDDGRQCKSDIEYLRRHPECGITFIQDKPFKPDNPKNKFRQIDRDFTINTLNRPIPVEPIIPSAPPIGKTPEIGQAITDSPYLPQDYTGRYDLNGRRILADTHYGQNMDEYVSTKIVNAFNRSGYGIVPRIGNDSYSHQEPNQRILTDEELIERQIKQTKTRTTLPKPRRPLPEIPGSELIVVDPEVEEALVIQQAERFIRKGRPQISRREAEQIADFFIQKNILRERTIEILQEYNLYDEAFELNLEKIPDPYERAAIRKLRAMRIIRQQERERGIRRVGEVELEDFGAGVGIPNEAPPPVRRTRIRPLADPRDIEFSEQVRPRGMTEEESIDAQIKQLTRNSTQEEAKQIEESQIKAQKRRMTLPKRKVPVPDIEGTELVVVEPEKEELLIIREAERFTRAGRPQISQREAEQIANKFLEKGISRSRTLQILEEFGLYDTQGEFELQQIADPKERAMIRRMRAQRLMTETRDTNLLPTRQQDIELTEYTPLTRGRTDIAPGRTRFEKIYDKTAARLPEEARTLAGSVKRSAQEFNENIRTRSLEARVNMRATTARVFGQRYSSIRQEAFEQRGGDIELTAPEGNINIRRPATEDITGIRPGDLQLDFNPLSEEYQEGFIRTTRTTTGSITGRTRPTLTYAQRLRGVRSGAFSGEAAVGSVGAAGGVAIGFGVAGLMGMAGVDNNFEIAAGAGGAGGAGARILTMAGSRALTRGTTSAIAETATYTAIRGGTSILRGAAEGAIIGVIALPVDMALNDHFTRHGMSHAEANVASGGIVGGGATALTTIGLASLGAAPETLGISLAVGAVALGAATLIGWFTGEEQDRQERQVRRERERLNTTSAARQRLLATLPTYNYNFTVALAAFPDKDSLGMDDDTWGSFSTNSFRMFNPRPIGANPTPAGDPPTGDEKRINDLFGKYIMHQLINRVCTGSTGCEELRRQDQGELTEDEINFLNNKTASTWQGQADMQVEMSVQELTYNTQRINNAKLQMLNAWNDEQKIASQLDPYIVQTAYLDPRFQQQYLLAIRLDAEQRVVDAYKNDQTRIEQLPKNIRDVARLDPEFDNMIHQYYNTMETTAGQLSVTVPQLIELQGLTGEAQKNRYEEIQFNNIKQDPVVVAEAQEIAREEDLVRNAEFYDIDQAYMLSDPTNITNWRPSDSQILQAYNAGMTLREYTDYMHELAKGEDADFTRLPQYTQEQIEQFTESDVEAFQAELQMSGHDGLYTWDSQNRSWILHDEVGNSAVASQSFLNRYTPRYLLQARQEYADMIHGLNQSNQAEVDNYNANLLRELTSYGRHYDALVADINNERLYAGRSDLLFYDVGKIYNENKIEFTPLSDRLRDAPNVLSENEATGRQLGEESRAEKKRAAAEKYGLTVPQYENMKRTMASKGITNVTQEQVDQAAQEIKSSAANAQPTTSEPAASQPAAS